MEDSAIRLEQVSFGYDGSEILENLSLEVRRGEVLGILGRVGAGKTRLLRLISGLERPGRGTIRFSPPEHEVRASFIFQQDLLIPWLTVEENLNCALRVGTPRENIRLLAGQVGLGSQLACRPDELSGGMRQKVNFARGFLNHDPIVLMDEPFGMLDPVEKRGLLEKFGTLQRASRATVLLVTHDVREALAACDRIGFLSKKKKQLTALFDNPFRGQYKEAVLLESPDYRKLLRSLSDLYESEDRA
jgi:ABC-type nitrate/sulfonate/bicarbonate transport system ATPase subunit